MWWTTFPWKTCRRIECTGAAVSLCARNNDHDNNNRGFSWKIEAFLLISGAGFYEEHARHGCTGPAVAILCVCLSARNPPFCFLHSPSSFPAVTHTLRIFKILSSTKMSLSKVRFLFKILVSNFDSAWRVSQLFNPNAKFYKKWKHQNL